MLERLLFVSFLFLKLAVNAAPGSTLYNVNQEPPNYNFFLKPEKDVKINLNEGLAWIKNHFSLSSQFSFQLKNIETDTLGMIHYRYVQLFQTVPVEFAMLIVHTKNGNVVSANGNIYEKFNPQFNTVLISTQLAEEIAKKSVSGEKEVRLDQTRDSLNFVYCPDANGILEPHFKIDVFIANSQIRKYVFVNANTGVISYELNRIHETDVIGTAVTLYNGTRNITVDSLSSSLYRLQETGRGNGIRTWNLFGDTLLASALNVTDSDNYWDSPGVRHAYDAHFGAEMSYDYFSSVFNRNSFDNNGGIIDSYVGYGFGVANAFWNGNSMVFGNGNGGTSGPFTSLDIVGHEFTHAVTQYTANLIYQNESGAINESVSDIFGVVIDYYVNPASANFLLGEQIHPFNIPSRNMTNPNSTGGPDTYLGTYWYSGSNDNGGVHTNSSIMNYWFYLIVNGGSGINDNSQYFSVSPIGMSAAASIVYRALTIYMTPTTQFANARTATLQAAEDLYGPCSPELINLMDAWHAVGVGISHSNYVSAAFTSDYSTTNCVFPLTLSFTNNSTNASQYIWDFGDGSTSTLINPTHVYDSMGIFTVKLIAIGPSSCYQADTVAINNYIYLLNPGAQPIDCSPSPFPFTSYLQGITQVNFNTIDRSSSVSYYEGYEDLTCTHSTTITAGIYQPFSFETYIEFGYIWIDYDNSGSFSNSEMVYNSITNKALHVDSILPPSNAQTNTPLRMRIGSSSTPLTSACSQPSYGQYEDYTVTILPNLNPPIANFGTSDTLINVGDSVYLENYSLNLPSNYYWSFPGANVEFSTIVNPTISYDSIGVYSISLFVSNSFGQDSLLQSQYIVVSDVNQMCDSTISNAAHGFLFDSGGEGGNYGSNENCSFLIAPDCALDLTIVFHFFDTYNVSDKLKVYDGVGPNTTLLGTFYGSNVNTPTGPITTTTGMINLVWESDFFNFDGGFKIEWFSTLPASAPILNYSISDTTPAFNTPVTFIDSSVPNVQIRNWSFGDGFSASAQSAIHSYSQPGIYTATLMVNNCIDSAVAMQTIYVQQPPNVYSSTTIFDTTVACGQVIPIEFPLENTGFGALVYNLSLSGNPINDTIASGDSGFAVFYLDVSNLFPGNYTDTVKISTNDPQDPQVNIPISYTVFSEPQLTVSNNDLYFPFTQMGAVNTLPLVVQNAGCDSLFVSSLLFSDADFSSNVSTFDLAPYTDTMIFISLAPTIENTYIDTVWFYSNDNPVYVLLNAQSLNAPLFSHTPAYFTDTTFECNDTIVVPITIYNNGVATLIANIDIDVPQEQAGYYFFDGFEDGNLAPWGTIGQPTPTFPTTNVGAGTRCLVIDSDDFSDEVGLGLPPNQIKEFKWMMNGIYGFGGANISPYGNTIFTLRKNFSNFFTMQYTYGGSGDVETIVNGVTTSIDLPSYPTTAVGTWLNCSLFLNYQSNTYNLFINGQQYAFDAPFSPSTVGGGGPTSIRLKKGYNSNSALSRYDNIIAGTPVNQDWIDTTSYNSITVMPGDSAVINVPMTSTGIQNGTYYSNITITTNDPLTPSVIIPVSLTIAVDSNGTAEVSDICQNLGYLYQNEIYENEFEIKNMSCNLLTITDLNPSNLVYSFANTNFQIPGYDSLTVNLTLQNPSLGTFIDSIFIMNSDQVTSVCYSYTVVLAPSLAFSDTTMSLNIAPCADSISETFYISNAGGGELIFNSIIGDSAAPSLNQVVSNFNASYENITDLVPNIYNFDEGINGNQINTGGLAMYAAGNKISLNGSTFLPYSEGGVYTNPANGLVGATSKKQTGIFMFAADVTSNSFHITGNTGTGGAGITDGSVLSTVANGKSYSGFVSRTYNASTPSINHLIITEQNPAISQTFSSNTAVQNHVLSGLPSNSRIYYLLYSSEVGGYISDQEHLAIMNEFLLLLQGGTNISLSTSSGQITNSDSIAISISINTNKPIGTYYESIIFATNNPIQQNDTLHLVYSVYPSPCGNFTYSQPNSCASYLNFNYESENPATSWLWNFGDGATSSLQNPSHFYASNGNFLVTQVACVNNFCDTLTQPITITQVLGPNPTVCSVGSWSSNPTIGIDNFQLANINNSSVISESGYEDFTCSDTTTLEIGIPYPFTVSYGNNFSQNFKMWLDLDGNGIFAIDELLFEDQIEFGSISGNILIPSSVANYNEPRRLRIASGLYGQTITSACQTLSQGEYEDYTVYFLPFTSPPIASASSTNINACQGQFQFTDQSSNSPTSWLWSFGDGSTSTQQNPLHSYSSSGTFIVTLTVTNSNGSDDYSFNVVSNFLDVSINVPAYGLINTSVQFTLSTSALTNVSFSWYSNAINVYNDTANFIYTVPGTYQVFLSASNGWCSTTIASSIIIVSDPIYPIAAANYNNPDLCQGLIQFNDFSVNYPISWLWDFGDGSTPATSQNPTHNYASSGSYTVTLIVFNVFGSDTFSFDCLINLPDFDIIAPSQGIVGLPISMTTTNSNLISWLWDFGDGNTATISSPTNTYLSSGNYIVSVEGTSDDLCLITKDHSINIIPQTSNVYEIESSLSVYPNPNYGNLFIHNDSGVIVEKIDITNEMGQILMSFSAPNSDDDITLNIASFAPGVYFVQIELSNKQTFNNKIILLKGQ